MPTLLPPPPPRASDRWRKLLAFSGEPQVATDPNSLAYQKHRRQGLYAPQPMAPQEASTDGGMVSTMPVDPMEKPGLSIAPRSPRTQNEFRLQQTRDRIDRLQNPQNPGYEPVRNNDRGFWGRFWDITREAIIGAGQAYANSSGTPEQRMLSMIGGAAGGGLIGGFDPKVDERRQRLADIGELQRQEGQIMQRMDADSQLGMREVQQRLAEAQTREAEMRPEIQQAKIEADYREALMRFQNESEKTSAGWYIEQWKGRDTFDPENNPTDRMMAEQAAKLTGGKLILGPKQPGDKFTFIPKGEAIYVGNPRTGEVTLGADAPSSESAMKISRADLPDDRFPALRPYTDIGIRAAAELSTMTGGEKAMDEGVKQVLLNTPDFEGKFPYRNPDGTLDVQKVNYDLLHGTLKMEFRDVYKNLSGNNEQALAKKKMELIEQSKHYREPVERLRTALATHRPDPQNSEFMSLDEVLEKFNKIISMPINQQINGRYDNGRTRAKMLEKFFEALKYIRFN